MVKTPVVTTAVRGSSVFDPKPFANLGDSASLSKFHKDQIVFSQGDLASCIESGIVKVTTHSKHGKKAIVAILGTGDFLRREALAGHPRRTATVTAMTDCSIWRLDVRALLQVLSDEPTFSAQFIAYLAARKFQLEDDLADQLLNSVEKRLARLLLLLMEPGVERPPQSATVRITQDPTRGDDRDDAITRVSFFMSKLRRLGHRLQRQADDTRRFTDRLSP